MAIVVERMGIMRGKSVSMCTMNGKSTLIIDGEHIDVPDYVTGKFGVSQSITNGKVTINGYEYIDGEWLKGGKKAKRKFTDIFKK